MNEDDFDDLFEANSIDDLVPETEQAEEPVVEAEPAEAPAEVEEEPSETVEAEAPGEVEDQGKGRSVPLATFLDMRDGKKEEAAGRKAETERADRIQAEFDAYKKAQEKPAYVADPQTDPVGALMQHKADVDHRLLMQKMQMSRTFALQTHDADKVQAAIAWAQARSAADPQFDDAVSAHQHPIEWIIEQHEEASTLDAFRADRIAVARRIAEEQGWFTSTPAIAEPTASATQLKAPKKRPSSLTDIPASNSKATPQSDQDDFDALFEK